MVKLLSFWTSPRHAHLAVLMLHAAVFLLLVAPTPASAAYLSRDDPLWPTADVWQSELGALLSFDATMNLFFNDAEDPLALYVAECEVALGNEPYFLANEGRGLCMQAHYCQRQFCALNGTADAQEHNLPAASVDVRSPGDISAAIRFASNYNISVTVKATGHSYPGSSTGRDSLLIWMSHYPKDDTIQDNYVDSCGTTYDSVIGVSGGEKVVEVILAVQDRNHIVTGWCPTVGAAGGWLQGVGISHTSRTFGYGVDQVVDFTVVLASGEVVTADACTNADLFWALRGGGGGTFGVVTGVHYKLHPVTPINSLFFSISGGGEWAKRKWLDFWLQKSPTMDSRWSGVWFETGAALVYSGSYWSGFFSGFLWEFYGWILWNFFFNPINLLYRWTFPTPPVLRSSSNWFEFRGGANAADDPESFMDTGYDDFVFGARILTTDVLESRKTEVRDFLVELGPSTGIVVGGYFLGGATNDVAPDATAINPVMRRAVLHIEVESPEAYKKLFKFFNNDISGASFNHHSVQEIEWRQSLWGSNYERLAELKQKYDPTNVFNCWHCVGYTGEEKEYSF